MPSFTFADAVIVVCCTFAATSLSLLYSVPVIAIGVLLWLVGVTTKIEWKRSTLPPSAIVGWHVKGPYQDLGAHFEDLTNDVPAVFGKLEHTLFGVYMDDPSTVKAEECRSYVAAWTPLQGLSDDQLNDIEEAAEKIGMDFRVMHEARESISAFWPIRINLAMMVAPLFMYTNRAKWFAANMTEDEGNCWGPPLEIYRHDEGWIEFANPREGMDVFAWHDDEPLHTRESEVVKKSK